jgi:hypothetical protein
VVKTLIVVTFLLGVVYAWTVSNYLLTLEMLRFMYSAKSGKYTGIMTSTSQEELESIKALGATVEPNFQFEGKLFRWETRLLWVTTGSTARYLFS